jgi:hypothetical protein
MSLEVNLIIHESENKQRATLGTVYSHRNYTSLEVIICCVPTILYLYKYNKYISGK